MELTLLQKLSITTKDRLEWYRALSVASAVGIPTAESLPKMVSAMSKIKHPLVPLIEVVVRRMRGAGKVRGGEDSRSFGTCLMDLVPDDEAMLIASGERSGDVEVGLTNAVTMVTEKRKLMGAVYGAMAKPMGYIAAMIALLLFFSTNLLPKFEATKPRSIWPHSAQLLASVADNVVYIAMGIVGMCVVAVLLLQFVLPRWTGDAREWCDRHLFPINIVASVIGASFLTSIAAYVKAGIPFVNAIDNIERGASPYMKSQCAQIRLAMRKGRSEQEALGGLSIIATRYQWIIEVYGMAANQDAAYATIAQELVLGVQVFVQRLFNLFIGNALLLCIGGMVLWIYMSMFAISLSGNATFGT